MTAARTQAQLLLQAALVEIDQGPAIGLPAHEVVTALAPVIFQMQVHRMVVSIGRW
jgi:hypothetical protein